MRTMYDSVTPDTISANATMVAGYVDGHYANLTAMRARFPHALIVGIAVSAHTDDGEVLDVERYDASPDEAPGWATRRRQAGVDPSVYCNSSTWPAVRAAFHAANVAEPHYWIAQWDGSPTIPAGAVAKQHSNPGPFDVSSVEPYWPGVDPKPAPTPSPIPEPNVPLTQQDIEAIAYHVWAYSHPGKAGDPDTPDVHQELHDGVNAAKAATAGVTAVDARLSAIESELGGIAAALAKLVPPAPKPAALEVPQEAPAETPVANETQQPVFVAQEPAQAPDSAAPAGA